MTDELDQRIPAELLRDVESLRALMDIVVPAKRVDQNLLIGTWNLKAFGGLTPKWQAAPSDSPKRDLYALRLIAEVVSRFDVVAIQEVLSDLTAIRQLLRTLGPNWGLIVTDVTRGSAGNNERLGFIFDRRRIHPSGLAAEIVLPSDASGIDEGAAQRQFARTPTRSALTPTAQNSSWLPCTSCMEHDHRIGCRSCVRSASGSRIGPDRAMRGTPTSLPLVTST
jgi:hypothetical protein